MKKAADSNGKIMDCKDIQPLLFEYMNRELGTGRSVVVREHLRKCEKCQAEAADMQATVELLRKSSGQDDGIIPRQLSDEHRKRISWSITHPVLDWIYAHHMLVSIVVTLMVLIAIGLWSCKEEEPQPAQVIYSVYIGRPEMTNGHSIKVQSPPIDPGSE